MSQSGSQFQIERELIRAQHLGRWLSDDEALAEAEAEQRQLLKKEGLERNRRKLMVLTLVCLLIPPLWPLALLLTLYLLFPSTTVRIGLAAGIGASVVLLLVVGASAALLVWLCLLLF